MTDTSAEQRAVARIRSENAATNAAVTGGASGGGSAASGSGATYSEYTYTDASGNVHVVQDYSGQGGGRYDTVISGPATQPGGGFSGSGFEKDREQLLNKPNIAAALKKGGVEERLIREGQIAGWQVGNRYFRTEQEANRYIENQKQAQISQYEKNISFINIRNASVINRAQSIENTYPAVKYDPKYGYMIREDIYKQQHQTPADKISTKYEETESKAAKFIKGAYGKDSPVNTWLKEIEKKHFGGVPDVITPNIPKPVKEFSEGFVEDLLEHPLKAGVSLGMGFGLVKGTGYVVSKIPWLAKGITAGKIGSKISAANIAGAGMVGVYGADVADRLLESENKARTLGGITSTELIPMVAGGYLGTKALPKLPYSLARKEPRGVLFEIKDMYTTPGKYLDEPGLMPRQTGINKEGMATFASETRGGLTDIYLRPPRNIAEKWLGELKGKSGYVKTSFGSYLKITPEGLRSDIATAGKLLTGKAAKAPLLERLPFRIEKRLNIKPTRLKFVLEEPRLELPERTWDYDVVNEILRGKGSMGNTPFGGKLKGATTRQQIAGVKHRPQLTTSSEKPMLRLNMKTPSKPGEFKSLFDEKQAELAKYVRDVFKSNKIKISSIRATTPTRSIPITVATATQALPRLQVATKERTRPKLQVMDRTESKIKEIEKMFNSVSVKGTGQRSQQQQRTPTSSKVTRIERITPMSSRHSAPKGIVAAYNLFDNAGVLPRNAPRPTPYDLPRGFEKPSNKPQPAPNPRRTPAPYSRTQPAPKQQPRPHPGTAKTPQPKEPGRPKPPDIPGRRIPPLPPIRFKAVIDKYKRNKKNRGRYAWDINNPIPTLESLLGEL